MTDKVEAVDERKFRIRTDMSITFGFKTLYRIEAVCDIPARNVKKGDFGGYIEGYHNLSGDAWIYGNAKVWGSAVVCDDAEVAGNALVYDRARISGQAKVNDNVRVCGDATLCGNVKAFDSAFIGGSAHICDESIISGNAKVFMKAKVKGESFISDNALVCGKEELFNMTMNIRQDRITKVSNITMFSDIYRKEREIAIQDICKTMFIADMCQNRYVR